MPKPFRTAALVICFIFLLGSIPSYAAEPSLVAPRYSYINSIKINFAIISGGIADITSSVEARNCTAVEQRVELQRWTGSEWKPVIEWKVTDQGTRSWFENAEWSVGGGSHRAVTFVSIYVGNTVVETAELASVVR